MHPIELLHELGHLILVLLLLLLLLRTSRLGTLAVSLALLILLTRDLDMQRLNFVLSEELIRIEGKVLNHLLNQWRNLHAVLRPQEILR